jgi:Lon protease-like protein
VEELGLFPLGIVLVPGERVPLHIFEPRYRELIGECLSEERELGLLYADEEGPREVGTRAAVAGVLRRYADGRLDVVVEGRERFRLVEETSGRSFRTARVEPVEDEVEEPDARGRELALELYRRVAELAGADAEDLGAAELLSFELAARVGLAPAAKQDLLERRSERERLELVVELLERAARAVAERREQQASAARNGRPRSSA